MPDVYPGAKYRPVAYRGLAKRQPYKAALLHTNGGGSQLFGWWQQLAGKGSTIGAQYQVFADGRAECYVDPALCVYHAFSASRWAIGIETEDDGNPSTPWTPAQVKTIAAILTYHGVPARRLTSDQPADGVGYHQQFTAWNESNHGCPGPTRVAQINAVLAAMTHTPAPEDDMSQADVDDIKSTLHALDGSEAGRFTQTIQRTDEIIHRGDLALGGIAQLTLQIAGLTAAVHALATATPGIDPATVQATIENTMAKALADLKVTLAVQAK